jgi:uncharacterized RDD family membrane protein YckC
MKNQLRFETPENVQVQYTPAGLGTRFLAWFIDQVILWCLIFVGIILVAMAGASLDILNRWTDLDSVEPGHVEAYIIGMIVLILGLGSFFYFTLSELFLRGQTLGKRSSKIRVVKQDGFALDAGSIFLRNVFRVVDNIPLTWIVPVMSRRSQRLGDMAAGTVVVSEEPPELTEIRVELSGRKAVETEFRFDGKLLEKLSEQDFEAVERLLDRWPDVPPDQRERLAEQLCAALAAKMQLEPPESGRQVRFLEDLLAAELRRENRLLG